VHLEPDRPAAPLLAEDRVRERWRDSPLRTAVEALQDELDRAVADGRFVAAVTGPDGTILWTHGSTWMRDRAAEVCFVPGGRWDESSMGTNALALALRTGRVAQVFSAEHYSAAVHDWVCYSAPVIELATGRVLGVFDLSTSWDRAQPLGLTTATLLAKNLSLLVAAAASMSAVAGVAASASAASTSAASGVAASTSAASGVAAAARSASSPGPPGTRATSTRAAREPTGAAPPRLFLSVLGRPRVQLDRDEVVLPRRQLELLTVLSLNPQGLTLEALHAALHPDNTVQPATVKAEVSHLRRALGAAVIASRPYRLAVPVRADHLDVIDDIAAGRTAAALRAYAGPLLPGTDAPALQEHARYIEAALRRAVLRSGDADLLFDFGGRMPDEVEVHQRCLDCLAADDPRAAVVRARLDTALA